MKSKRDSVIIYSGGLDSTTLLYEKRERVALAVTFDYGSNHAAREIACARHHCALLGVEHLVIELAFMSRYFQSSLLSGGDAIPSGSYDVYPYVICWSGDSNDLSNGKLLTLRFAIKEDADGEAFVRFTYTRDRDINYYVGGELKTRNLMADSLKIDLTAGEATAYVSDNVGAQAMAEKKDGNVPLVVGLSVGGTFVVVAAIIIPWIIAKRKRA